jgi:hypothetical protein
LTQKSDDTEIEHDLSLSAKRELERAKSVITKIVTTWAKQYNSLPSDEQEKVFRTLKS